MYCIIKLVIVHFDKSSPQIDTVAKGHSSYCTAVCFRLEKGEERRIDPLRQSIVTQAPSLPQEVTPEWQNSQRMVKMQTRKKPGTEKAAPSITGSIVLVLPPTLWLFWQLLQFIHKGRSSVFWIPAWLLGHLWCTYTPYLPQAVTEPLFSF